MLDKFLNPDNTNPKESWYSHDTSNAAVVVMANKILMYYRSEYQDAFHRLSSRIVPFKIDSHDRRYEIWTAITEGAASKLTVAQAMKLATKDPKSLVRLQSAFENFFRWEATKGFGAIGELKDFNGMGADEYTKIAKMNYEFWKQLNNHRVALEKKPLPHESLLLPAAPGDLFGWICGTEPDTGINRVLIAQIFRHSINAMQIDSFFGDSKFALFPRWDESTVIVEIGGGWGILPQQLYKVHNYPGKIILFDLPSVNIISEYFLSRTFPDKQIAHICNFDNISDIIKNNDITIVSAGCAMHPDRFPADLASIVFNSHSLAEMNDYEITAYLKLADRIIKPGGLFMHKNHTEFFNLDQVIEENFSWKMRGRNPEILCGAVTVDTVDKYFEALYVIGGKDAE